MKDYIKGYIFKVDVDVKLPQPYFKLFVRTRIAILKALGLKVGNIYWSETTKGYHFWFVAFTKRNLSDLDKCYIQFMLGDDHNRTNYNLIRCKFGYFKEFNCLFSSKEEVEIKCI